MLAFLAIKELYQTCEQQHECQAFIQITDKGQIIQDQLK